MTTDQLEQRIAAVEQTLVRIQRQLNPPPSMPGKAALLAAVGSMADDPGFEAAMAYGRYFRTTGREAPPDWKPGDPIPEPEFEE